MEYYSAWHCSERSLSGTSFNSHTQLQNCHHPYVTLRGLRHRGVGNWGCFLESGERAWNPAGWLCAEPQHCFPRCDLHGWETGASVKRFHRWIEKQPKAEVSRTQFETCKICTVKVFSQPCSDPRPVSLISCACALVPRLSHRGVISDP